MYQETHPVRPATFGESQNSHISLVREYAVRTLRGDDASLSAPGVAVHYSATLQGPVTLPYCRVLPFWRLFSRREPSSSFPHIVTTYIYIYIHHDGHVILLFSSSLVVVVKLLKLKEV